MEEPDGMQEEKGWEYFSPMRLKKMLREATIRKGNAVIVTRYVEKPRRIVANHHHHHHHHHHHVHHTIKRAVIHCGHGAKGKRFINRRAELLQYSHRLRQSARLPALPTTSSANKHKSPQTKAVNTQRKPKDGVASTCFGNCKLMIPNIFKLLSFQTKKASAKKKTSNKIKEFMKSLEVTNNAIHAANLGDTETNAHKIGKSMKTVKVGV
ncbi:hypothetical protein CsatB_004367 [Cannabis sativa]